ncbi:hypothetical protein ACFQVA_17545 [Actinomadura keratinilytica]
MGAASLPSVLAEADTAAERQVVAEGFAAGLETSQLFGAVAVLFGGAVAAFLLWRAERVLAADVPETAREAQEAQAAGAVPEKDDKPEAAGV